MTIRPFHLGINMGREGKGRVITFDHPRVMILVFSERT